MQRLENLHLVTHFGQIGRAGQTGRTAADNGYLAPVGRGRAGRLRAMLDAPVAHEALELADRDALALDAENARSLALGLLRADPSADRRRELSCAMIRAASARFPSRNCAMN